MKCKCNYPKDIKITSEHNGYIYRTRCKKCGGKFGSIDIEELLWSLGYLKKEDLYNGDKK